MRFDDPLLDLKPTCLAIMTLNAYILLPPPNQLFDYDITFRVDIYSVQPIKISSHFAFTPPLKIH